MLLIVITYAFNPDMSILDIIQIGFSLGNRKRLIAFGLIIVSGILAGIVVMLMCFVGIYVTASFSYLPHYLIYKEVVGFDGEDEIKRLEENIKF